MTQFAAIDLRNAKCIFTTYRVRCMNTDVGLSPKRDHQKQIWIEISKIITNLTLLIRIATNPTL